MAFISHDCTKCGHPDYWRFAKTSSPEICDAAGCGCRCTPGDPVVKPSFGPDGRQVERILKPGDKLGSVPTCGCQQCQALYEQATTAEPPSSAAPSTRQIRKWAAEHDVPCPATGRIPRAVIEAYESTLETA